MSYYTQRITADDLDECNVEFRFLKYNEFFGASRQREPKFDRNIFDLNLMEKRSQQKPETLQFFMHHNSDVNDEGGLTDYASALLWFTGYATTPRHTFRDMVCQYGFRGGSADIKYNIALQDGMRTVLFVVVADSVADGIAKALAGALAMSVQYFEMRHNYPVFPVIILVEKIIILAKVTIPEEAEMYIGNNMRPNRATLIEMYSPIDVYCANESRYKDKDLIVLLGAMEAFKRFMPRGAIF